jgi:hypothetical protein
MVPEEPDDKTKQELVDVLGRLTTGKAGKDDMRQLVKHLRRYTRVGFKGVGFNGKGIVDLLLYIAPRLPVRSQMSLQSAYDGVTGGSLAGQVIKSASRNSAAIGGLTGALATAGELAPPFWFTLPIEVVAETLVVTAIEMRMIAELHESYGCPIAGTEAERAEAIVEAWSSRRGIDMKAVEKRGRSEFSRNTGLGKQFGRVVKRKVMVRAARNVGSLAPLFIGAVIGAESNRRSTRDIGDAIVRDLAKTSPSQQ